ncbi:MAG: SHOCT domain-containing protein [Acidimicrobiales bacterium]
MMWDGGNGSMWQWGGLMILAVLAAIAVGTWLVVRASRHPERRVGDRARDILAERYANGDLSTDEYHERRDALR